MTSPDFMPIPRTFGHYFAAPNGVVIRIRPGRGTRSGRVVTPTWTGKNSQHASVRLSVGGRVTKRSLADVLGWTFLGAPPDGLHYRFRLRSRDHLGLDNVCLADASGRPVE